MFGQTVGDSLHICKRLLEVVLGERISEIKFISREHSISNTFGMRAVRLDLYIKSESGAIYNVEMQNANNKDLEKRMRFHQSKIDSQNIPAGSDFISAPNTVIIFICDFDYFGAGYPQYERVSYVQPIGVQQLWHDGSRAIMLNTHFNSQILQRTPSRMNLSGTIKTSSAASNNLLELCEFLTIMRNGDTGRSYSYELAQALADKLYEVRMDSEKEVEFMSFEEYLREHERLRDYELIRNLAKNYPLRK